MSRRHLWIPPELWTRIQKAAALASYNADKPVSTAEWIREALEKAVSQQR